MASVVMRSTGPRSIDLSSQLPLAAGPSVAAGACTGSKSSLPAIPRTGCEPMEAPGVVHQQDPGNAVAEVHDGDGCRIHEHALELVEVGTGVVGDEHPDQVAVRADHDPAARVACHDLLDLVEDTSLRLDEALAGREVEAGRAVLHRIPELGASEGGQGAARPVAGVHLDQRVGGADLEP